MWKERLKHNHNQFAIKYLNKRFETYKNAVLYKADNKLKAKADLYRHLVKYIQQVYDYTLILEEDLINNNVEIYFPEDKEKVFVEKEEVHIKDMETNKDWKRAYEQEVE
jgi:hypothetical protein